MLPGEAPEDLPQNREAAGAVARVDRCWHRATFATSTSKATYLWKHTHTYTYYIYIHIWLVVWNMFYFPISWEFHHPNWRIHIFQRGRYTTNQRYIYIYIYGNPWVYVPYPYFYWRVNGHRMDEWVQSDSMLFRQHIMELFSTWFS